MGRATLDFEASNLDALVREDLACLRSGTFGPKDVLRLCRRTRQRACAALLRHLDVAAFQQGLQKAGLAYLFLLDRRARLASPDPYWLSRSAGVPYLDALASGDRALAAEIAAKSTPTHTKDMEDEDDFACFAALAELAAPLPDPARADAALAAFASSLRGAPSPRLDALRAVRARDARCFDGALRELLRDWKDRADGERKTGVADPYFANIEAHVCVEGLALVRLARWHGVATEESYPCLPGPAVELGTPDRRPDLWE